jgi:nucleotide-binding universal stress UspA family protein
MGVMEMQTKILFATDGREPAKDAGRLLRRLVDPDHVTLTILHAAPHDDGHAVQSGAQTILDKAQQEAFDAGIKAVTILALGDPDVAIERELGLGDYGLVVVGAGNHRWYDRLVLGTVSTQLIHDAAVPVLAVHRFRELDEGQVRVLVGVDGSASIERAIDTLIAVTSPTSVRVEVHSVIETSVVSAAGYPGAFVPLTFIDEVTAERKQAAQRYVTEAVQRFATAGYTAEGWTGEGDPATDLLDRAAATDADLIVVGARGLGAIARLAVGSVSAHVARHAPAALVAHAIAQQKQEG